LKVKYIYSACLEVETQDLTILMDPWFTDGIYDGSWYQFPKIDPFDYITKPDVIYISHIHPDHYDPKFLKKLFKKFGEIPIYIPDLKNNFLKLRAQFDGFNTIPIKEKCLGKTRLVIQPNYTDSLSDIDSSLYIFDKSSNKSFLNLNDCIYQENLTTSLKKIIAEDTEKLDFLASGYMGAGPYPQTFFDFNDKESLISEAEKKKNKFFDNYTKFTKAFDAEFNLPFAGEYFLGSNLSHLNNYRGNPDALEVKSFDPKALVLNSGGSIDLVSKDIVNERTKGLDQEELEKFLIKLGPKKMKYEDEINIPFTEINFIRLLKSALIKASSKCEYDKEYSFLFSIKEDGTIKKRYLCNIHSLAIEEIPLDEKLEINYYSEIFIDYRYLFGLLTTIYHWDNAAVGSHYDTRKHPKDFYSREIVNYLNFFSAI